jgi:hypothetical protein
MASDMGRVAESGWSCAADVVRVEIGEGLCTKKPWTTGKRISIWIRRGVFKPQAEWKFARSDSDFQIYYAVAVEQPEDVG